MTKPEKLPARHRGHLHDLPTRCPQMTVMAERVSEFAALFPARSNGLDAWMAAVEADDLPALHAFVHGLRIDPPAIVTGLTPPHSNGPVQGANTKVKFLKRQMYGQAEFVLLRQRILLA